MSNWHKNLSSPKIQIVFIEFLVWFIQRSHVNYLVKKDFSRQFYPQIYDFAIFCPKHLRMTDKSI